jgi:hypothetical protein
MAVVVLALDMSSSAYHIMAGATVGVCFIAEGPVRKNTFGRPAQK